MVYSAGTPRLAIRPFTLVAMAAISVLLARPVSAQLVCENDPTRTIFAGGPGEGSAGGACRQFDGDPLLCNRAFHLGPNGLASCYFDAGTMECRGCGPSNEGDSACTNTCRPTPVCEADPTRVFAGPPFSGQNGGACPQHDGNESACNQAFTLGANGVASCFYAGGACRGCGPSNERDGECANECRPAPVCAGAPTRVFAGPPFSGLNGGACRQHDGNESACNQAFTLGAAGIASCFYDSLQGDCFGCGPSNEGAGACTNVCRTDPGCAQDPSRTIFAGGPGTSACHQFDGDPASCDLAYHQGGDGVVASCFSAVECVPCGAGSGSLLMAQANGAAPICINACLPVPGCLDPTRTFFAGGPESRACRNFDGDQAACEIAYHLGGDGVAASCFYDPIDGDCLGCGPGNQADGDCTNSCVPPPPPPSCAGDPMRTNFVGGPGTGACRQVMNQPTCDVSFHRTDDDDLASCWWDGDECRGCGPSNESGGNCTNECRTAATTCPADPTRTFAGGPNTAACRQFDGNASACNGAYHLGSAGYASCFYDAATNECLGCGPSNEGDACINTCLPVPPCQDAARTIFTGHPGSAGCHRFDGDATMCLQAYVEGGAGASSCWYDAEDGACRGCGPDNANDGDCTNSCQLQVCVEDPARTVLGECGQFGADASACNQAFQLSDEGLPIACVAMPFCSGCGLRNQSDGLCRNACFAGVSTTAPAPALSFTGVAAAVVLLVGLAALGLRARRTE